MSLEIEYLFTEYDAANLQTLWIMDENIDVIPWYLLPENCSIMTNRVINDTNQTANIYLSDFNFSQLNAKTFDLIYLRLPKSKPLLDHLIANIPFLIKDNGILVFIGFNNEGIKNQAKKMVEALGSLNKQELLGNGLRYFEIEKTAVNQTEISEKYHELITVENNYDLTIMSKAGIYGYQKIDQGSQYLLEVFLKTYHKTPLNVLDLGAGYGLLSLVLGKKYPNASITATDNNITATDICALNFEKNHIEGKVIVDDCGSQLEKKSYDLIICNPPFHQGFKTSTALTQKFVDNAYRLLAKNGECWFVFNKFIKVEDIFVQNKIVFENIAENNQFKVIKIT